MTSSGARKQTQQLLFTVIITHYRAPSGLNHNQHATVTSRSHTVYTLFFFLLCPLHSPAHIATQSKISLRLHRIVQFHKFALNGTYCELTAMAKGYHRRSFICTASSHNVLIVHVGPVYIMTSMVVMLAAPWEAC